jgi:transcriptional regulator with XRE-family HTH domain
MTFAEKLQKLMSLRGETQRSLGLALSLSHRAIGGWLKSGVLPHPSTAKKLAEYFGVPVDDLLDDNRTLQRNDIREIVSQKLRADAQEARQAFPDAPQMAAMYIELKGIKEDWLKMLEQHNAIGKKMKELIERMPPNPKPFFTEAEWRRAEKLSRREEAKGGPFLERPS